MDLTNLKPAPQGARVAPLVIRDGQIYADWDSDWSTGK